MARAQRGSPRGHGIWPVASGVNEGASRQEIRGRAEAGGGEEERVRESW